MNILCGGVVHTDAAANKERWSRTSEGGGRGCGRGMQVRVGDGVFLGTVHASLEAMMLRARRGTHTGAMTKCSGGECKGGRQGTNAAVREEDIDNGRACGRWACGQAGRASLVAGAEVSGRSLRERVAPAVGSEDVFLVMKMRLPWRIGSATKGN